MHIYTLKVYIYVYLYTCIYIRYNTGISTIFEGWQNSHLERLRRLLSLFLLIRCEIIQKCETFHFN